MSTVAEHIVTALAQQGVKTVWGVVGDALNPVTDAIRRNDDIDWVGVRHEEAGAFAASAQAQLTGGLGVCMGTVGPGSIHLLNGLYDAKKSHAPVLALCGQVPLAELGSDFFQEVNNDVVFADVAVFNHTITSPEQLPGMLERAVQAALSERGVAVLTLPGDVGGLDLPKGKPEARFIAPPAQVVPDADAVRDAAERIDAAGKVTLLVGIGAREAREEVLALAEKLSAPMVLTLKAKEGLERENPFQVGQTGLIGNPAARRALDQCDLLLMLGTDFPYSDWYPEGKVVVQVDERGAHLGRRTPVDAGIVGDAGLTARALLDRVSAKADRDHLEDAAGRYASWREDQKQLADPKFEDSGLVHKLRAKFDNPDQRIRPEALADALNTYAAADAIFTSDTGMSTVWLSRFVELHGTRRLVGSYNLGSMANAMPQALGAQALDKARQVIAFCGDGGLTMLLGDVITAVAYELPVKLVVFDNGRLGMVKLEQEQGGLPEFGTVLANPDLAAVARAMGLHGIRVEGADTLHDAVREALAHPGPVLLDVITNPDEISLPPRVKVADGWGFAVAKLSEELESRRS
ncbi:thiamine pyrophosphate-binding protein [Solirubrobacter ginsenosidimutans]|uniref:Thiamine pyrophosphate-binding protein n=1 Tax=Solirubrobacter ginsenosidimutans TaxID=490573 RepID=A0A9X3MR34_9ACTN|nr:thiamine pyrophosphate-dependent enzyme [Solirubrobacter ginsenosidimutans]MDA0160915.1 thiamine pyrophosphate-binding protein [Solirubrobacter ginsenosidimutans]